MDAFHIDEKRATKHLMDLLRVAGSSGSEKKVADLVIKKLKAAGCTDAWIRFDQAHKKIGNGYETGNLIVRMPGTYKASRRLFISHLDTVPICRGAVPVRNGRRIDSKGETALGADNRTAVACLVTLAEMILKDDVPHPPLTLLFTVGEEVGLLGARFLKISDLGNPKMGFNIDAGAPQELITAAIGAYRWEAEVFGAASHAGVHPERGISAILIASRAVEQMADRGFYGRIRKGQRRGTANVGSFQGGENTNQVTEYVRVLGECRSHDPLFLERIVEEHQDAFERAADSVRNTQGKKGQIKFNAVQDYTAFALDKNDPVVDFAKSTASLLGMKPKLVKIDGGLDANCLNAKGIPTITFGAGQHGPHTLEEYVNLDEYIGGCRLALALATT